MYYAKEFVDRLYQSRHIIIFGAHLAAAEVAYCLMARPYYLKIEKFMVSNRQNNPNELLGIPVIDIEEGKRYYKEALILAAMMEKHICEVMKLLHEQGFEHVVLMNFESDLWSQLRGNYFQQMSLEQGKKYLTLEDEIEKICSKDCKSENDIKVYMVRSHVDRNLQADLSIYDWEMPIQAGAALTEKRILPLCDNQGENISYKNKEYCELTVLYWIWKNDRSKYAGLCHYRRHFNLNADLLNRICSSDIDVVLTIPILNYPDVQTVYANDHIAKDWDIMLEVLKELQPDYFNTAEEVRQGVFYYGYNMFIARKEILNEYCKWLFPILEYCENRCGCKADVYQNRYVGFLAERLMSIYFLHHEDKYKIVHAQKTFLN